VRKSAYPGFVHDKRSRVVRLRLADRTIHEGRLRHTRRVVPVLTLVGAVVEARRHP
jgi:hypothetical protein